MQFFLHDVLEFPASMAEVQLSHPIQNIIDIDFVLCDIHSHHPHLQVCPMWHCSWHAHLHPLLCPSSALLSIIQHEEILPVTFASRLADAAAQKS